MAQKHLFIFGLGFTGARLAQTLLEQSGNDWCVSGTVQTFDRAKEVYETIRSKVEGFKPDSLSVYVLRSEKFLLYQQDEAGERGSLKPVGIDEVFHKVSYVLSTVPVDRKTKVDAVLQQEKLAAQVKKLALQGEIVWGGYLSTTSVYGNHDGAWVDEDTQVPFEDLGRRGKLRLTAENAWKFSTGMPMHIFRLPGIYGPGRGSLSRARKGSARSVVKKDQVFSRIHVDDIVGVVIASMRQPNPNRVYNVVDDLPAESYVVTEHACKLLGLKPPPREDFDVAKESMSPMAQSFYSESKRVRNERIKKELGYLLKYPTYKEGLKAQFDEEEAGGWTLVDPVVSTKEKPPSGAPEIVCGTGTQRSGQASGALTKDNNKWRDWMHFAMEAMTQLFGLISNLVRAILFTRTQKRVCLIVDNGSLRPEPTLQLRKVAADLKALVASNVSDVIAVSARHSNKIPHAKLEGTGARVLGEVVEGLAGQDITKLIVLPYFLGSSKTVSSFIPETVEAMKQKTQSSFEYTVTPPLVDLSSRSSSEALHESGVAVALTKLVEDKLTTVGQAPVVLVDHGTPTHQVNKVRRALAAALRIRLGDRISTLVDCSMERREGDAYAFNDPLLESVFDLGGLNSGTVILAYLFLAPGRHAGKGGDIHEILAQVKADRPGLEIVETELLGEMREDMLTVLQQRLQSAL